GDVYAEVRRLRGAVDADSLEPAVEVAFRRQRPAQTVDRVQVRVGEVVLAVERRRSGAVRDPRAERAGRLDVAARDRIGQRRPKRHASIETQRVDAEMMNRET